MSWVAIDENVSNIFTKVTPRPQSSGSSSKLELGGPVTILP
jgi:hypothetical protein